MKLKSTPKKEVIQSQEEESTNKSNEISNSQMIDLLKNGVDSRKNQDEDDKLKR